jgi:hypothetical protein
VLSTSPRSAGSTSTSLATIYDELVDTLLFTEAFAQRKKMGLHQAAGFNAARLVVVGLVVTFVPKVTI